MNRYVKVRQAISTLPLMLSVVGLTLQYVGFSIAGLWGFSATYICIVLSVVGAALATFGHRSVRVMHPSSGIVMALYLFCLATWISAAFAGEAEARAAAIRLTALVIWSVTMAVYVVNASALRLDLLCRWLSLWFGALAFTALTDFAGWTEFYDLVYIPTERSGGLLGGPDNAARLLAVGLVMQVTYLAGEAPKSFRQRALGAIVIALTLAGIVVTGSRAGYLLVVLGIGMVAVMKGVGRGVRALSPAVLVLALSGTALLSPSLRQKLLTVSYLRVESMASVLTSGVELRGGSVVERYYLAKDAIVRSFDNPVVGIGVGLDKSSRLEGRPQLEQGTLRLAAPRGLRLVNSSHNTYLSVLLEMGMFGAVPFVLLVVFMGSRLHQRYSGTGDWADSAIFVCYVLYCVAMGTQTLHLKHNLFYYLFLPLALGLRVGLQPQPELDPSVHEGELDGATVATGRSSE